MRQLLKRSASRPAAAQGDQGTDLVLYGCNKQPYWLDSIQAYSLDFSGRVTLPSNKNFQLVLDGNPALGNRSTSSANQQYQHPGGSDITLQFGKVFAAASVEVYTVDVAWPLSPVQAFGVSLTAVIQKKACA
jgi:hypothetical protein